MLHEYKKVVSSVVEKILLEMKIEDKIIIEQPKKIEFGDIAIPLFGIAKKNNLNPIKLAQDVASKITHELISDVNVVGGFINLYLNKQKVIQDLFNKDFKNKINIGNNEVITIDYSSPNIAKPFHVGHLRTTIIGKSLVNLYTHLGYQVVRINHLGDYGTQFGKLIVSINLWGDLETIKKNPIKELVALYIKFHQEAEKNPDLEEEARKQFTLLEAKNKENYQLWEWICEVSLEEFKRVYNTLDMQFDHYLGESFYTDKMDAIVQKLEEKNLLISNEDGSKVVALEKYNLPDALIIKKDGSSIYMTRDLAAAYYRYETFKFSKSLYVVGTTQEVHFKQLFKILELMNEDFAKNMEHVNFGQVSLETGTLSTRKGNIVYLESLLDQAVIKAKEVIQTKESEVDPNEIASKIGIGAVLFQELFHSRKKDYKFSFEKMLSFEGESGPYIQYMSVRIKNILRLAKLDNLEQTYYNSLELDNTLWQIILYLSSFEEKLLVSAAENDFVVFTHYLMNLAQEFSKYYAQTKILEGTQENQSDKLNIINKILEVLETGMNLLGIASIEKM